MVIWLIGMSGAGKTTIGEALHRRIKQELKSVVLLDGDSFREVFGNDLGHSMEDRRTNAGRISRLCRFLDGQGIHIICMVLSIFPDWQEWNRKHFSSYYEIYIQVPFDVLIERDAKGLYRKALEGEIKNVVGVDIEFPEPPHCDYVIHNDFDSKSIDRFVNEIMKNLAGVFNWNHAERGKW